MMNEFAKVLLAKVGIKPSEQDKFMPYQIDA